MFLYGLYFYYVSDRLLHGHFDAAVAYLHDDYLIVKAGIEGCFAACRRGCADEYAAYGFLCVWCRVVEYQFPILINDSRCSTFGDCVADYNMLMFLFF